MSKATIFHLYCYWNTRTTQQIGNSKHMPPHLAFPEYKSILPLGPENARDNMAGVHVTTVRSMRTPQQLNFSLLFQNECMESRWEHVISGLLPQIPRRCMIHLHTTLSLTTATSPIKIATLQPPHQYNRTHGRKGYPTRAIVHIVLAFFATSTRELNKTSSRWSTLDVDWGSK